MNRKTIGLFVIIGFVAGMIVFGFFYWRHSQLYPSTEDAYVNGDIFAVSSRVPGTILTIPVVENQLVKKNQLIATLDPRDYDKEVEKAEAGLAEADSVLALDNVRITQAQAQVDAAKSQLDLAKIEMKRATRLYKTGSMPKQKYDKAMTAYRVASAQYEVALKALDMARAELRVSQERAKLARAKLDKAKLKRSYCTIVSPVEGIVSKKTAEVGQVVAPGQPLCSVVPLRGKHIWIEANFKETQLARIRPGQSATFYTDVNPGRKYRGHVESLSAGTGAAFSLLPPENATGNWVKIVQRLPVRIALDPGTNKDYSLRLGLSVHVKIDTTTGNLQ